MIDIALDTETHDLLFVNNDLVLASDAQQFEQNIKIRLQFFSEEWFLNINNGLPFYSDILVKNPNIQNIDAIIKAQILDTQDAIELLEYVSSFNNASSTYTINFTVRSIFGESQLLISLFN